MTRENLSYLSVAILGLYGAFTSKGIFLFMGLVFIAIGVAERLKTKNKIDK